MSTYDFHWRTCEPELSIGHCTYDSQKQMKILREKKMDFLCRLGFVVMLTFKSSKNKYDHVSFM